MMPLRSEKMSHSFSFRITVSGTEVVGTEFSQEKSYSIYSLTCLIHFCCFLKMMEVKKNFRHGRMCDVPASTVLHLNVLRDATPPLRPGNSRGEKSNFMHILPNLYAEVCFKAINGEEQCSELFYRCSSNSTPACI